MKQKTSHLDKVEIEINPGLEKVAFYEASLKKRNEEYELKRKEALKLTFEKRQVDKELTMAKHKIAQLNSDFEVIHAELDNFPSAVQSRFQEAIIEKEQIISDLMKKLEESEELIIQKDAQIDQLSTKLETAKRMLTQLRDSLQDAHRSIGELTQQGKQELELKQTFVVRANDLLNTVKRSEIEEYMVNRALVVVHTVLQENQQLKIRVDLLNEEIAQMTKEAAAEEDIHLKDELRLVANQKLDLSPKKTKKFFTQGTLMLDCDKMFE